MKLRAFASLFVAFPITLTVAVLTINAQSTLRGTWSAQLSKSEPWIQVSFQDARGHHGSSFSLRDAGVQLGAQGPVQFTVTREAGSFAFTGAVKGDLASGFVEFTSNPEFPRSMASLGY